MAYQDIELPVFTMTYPSDSKLWITIPKPQPAARMRLFCVPYAGGSLSAYSKWPALLGDDVEVAVIQLPGHGSRYREPPLTRLSAVTQALTGVMPPLLDKPYAVFGQSLGALISFELLRELRRQQHPAPQHLFVSARSAPHLANDWMPIHTLADAPMVKEVQRRYGGIPQAILEDDELLQLFLPVLRADLEILETYDYTPGAPLACDLTVYGGYQDWATPDEQLSVWAEHTSGRFVQQMFPGNHFFVQNTPSFLRAFSSHLADLVVRV